MRIQYRDALFVSDIPLALSAGCNTSKQKIVCHRYLDQMNEEELSRCVSLSRQGKAAVVCLANEYERKFCPKFVADEFCQIDFGVKSAIILNHMFTGNYLNENIGHEVINLFSPDEGQQCVYLCDDGKFTRDDIFVEYVVQVRRPDKTAHTLEIINIASGLRKFEIGKDEEPCYGGKLISKIFANNKSQQDVCVTFLTEDIVKPKSKAYILGNESHQSDNRHEIFLKGYHPSRKMREYIIEEGGPDGTIKKDSWYYELKQYIEYLLRGGDGEPLPKINLTCDTSVSFAEIYGVLRRELSYSDAFKYHIEKRPDWFLEFCRLQGYTCANDEQVQCVLREWRHIDLLIKCDKHWFVVENKIHSGLNGIDGSQLSVYKARVEKYIADNEIGVVDVSYILLLPDHNNIELSDSDAKCWKIIRYSDVYNFLSDRACKCDKEQQDFLRAIEPHAQSDFNSSVMHKRFVRAIKETHIN